MPADSIGEHSLPRGLSPTAPWHRQCSRMSPPSSAVAVPSGCLALRRPGQFSAPMPATGNNFSSQPWAGGPLSFVRMVAGPTAHLLLGMSCLLLGVWTVRRLGCGTGFGSIVVRGRRRIWLRGTDRRPPLSLNRSRAVPACVGRGLPGGHTHSLSGSLSPARDLRQDDHHVLRALHFALHREHVCLRSDAR